MWSRESQGEWMRARTRFSKISNCISGMVWDGKTAIFGHSARIGTDNGHIGALTGCLGAALSDVIGFLQGRPERIYEYDLAALGRIESGSERSGRRVMTGAARVSSLAPDAATSDQNGLLRAPPTSVSGHPIRWPHAAVSHGLDKFPAAFSRIVMDSTTSHGRTIGYWNRAAGAGLHHWRECFGRNHRGDSLRVRQSRCLRPGPTCGPPRQECRRIRLARTGKRFPALPSDSGTRSARLHALINQKAPEAGDRAEKATGLILLQRALMHQMLKKGIGVGAGRQRPVQFGPAV